MRGKAEGTNPLRFRNSDFLRRRVLAYICIIYLYNGKGLKWKRNVQFAEKSIPLSITRKNIAVTLAPKKRIRKNKGIS